MTDVEVPGACIILIGLFALQRYGTHRVGFLFAPIVCIWLFCISAIGIYNIFYWNPHVYQALSPYYVFQFLRKTRRGGWMALGGILLCITGSFVCLVIDLLTFYSNFPGSNAFFQFYRIRNHVCWSWALFSAINQGMLF